jgi:hypothetical protein
MWRCVRAVKAMPVTPLLKINQNITDITQIFLKLWIFTNLKHGLSSGIISF